MAEARTGRRGRGGGGGSGSGGTVEGRVVEALLEIGGMSLGGLVGGVVPPDAINKVLDGLQGIVGFNLDYLLNAGGVLVPALLMRSGLAIEGSEGFFQEFFRKMRDRRASMPTDAAQQSNWLRDLARETLRDKPIEKKAAKAEADDLSAFEALGALDDAHMDSYIEAMEALPADQRKQVDDNMRKAKMSPAALCGATDPRLPLIQRQQLLRQLFTAPDPTVGKEIISGFKKAFDVIQKTGLKDLEDILSSSDSPSRKKFRQGQDAAIVGGRAAVNFTRRLLPKG